jgi:hypothetical protein
LQELLQEYALDTDTRRRWQARSNFFDSPNHVLAAIAREKGYVTLLEIERDSEFF